MHCRRVTPMATELSHMGCGAVAKPGHRLGTCLSAYDPVWLTSGHWPRYSVEQPMLDQFTDLLTSSVMDCAVPTLRIICAAVCPGFSQCHSSTWSWSQVPRMSCRTITPEGSTTLPSVLRLHLPAQLYSVTISHCRMKCSEPLSRPLPWWVLHGRGYISY